MDCREARRLLDRGVRPGFTSFERVALGWHVARCAACRSYTPYDDDSLLEALLAQDITVTLAQTTPQRGKRSRIARRVGLGMLLLVFIWLISIVGRTAFAWYTIQQNVQAMRLPTATIRSVAFAASSASPSPVKRTPAPSPRATVSQASPVARITPVATQSLAVPTLRPTNATIEPPSDTPITVLLLGSDGRPDETGPERSDAIVIVRLDPVRRRVALLSLPRDLIVPIPGYGQARINSASVYGEQFGEPGGGVGLMRRTVSALLNTPIDYVVHVNFAGFIGAVDAIGGITIDVPQELYDPAYPTMDYGYTVAHFLPGPQQMDGATALMYSRIRHMDSDFERMRRQQAVLLGIAHRLREQNLLEQVQSVAAITTALRDYVQTDLSQNRLMSLVWAFRNLSPDAVERYTLDVNMISVNVNPSDPYAEYARPGAIQQVTEQLLNGPDTSGDGR